MVLTKRALQGKQHLRLAVGSNKSWLGAAATLAALFLLLPIASAAIEAAAVSMRTAFADAAEGMATVHHRHHAQ